MRRVGDKNAFWANASTGVATGSAAVEIARGVENFAIYITVGAGATVTVEVAHHGDLNADGTEPDTHAGVWHTLYYVDAPAQIVFSGAGSAAIIIPDFVPGWVRLKSSADVTATAGWEAISG